MGSERLALTRSGRDVVESVLMAAAWIAVGLGALFVGALLDPFTGGGMGVVGVFAAICVLGALATLYITTRRGSVEIRHDELVIRGAGGPGRPLRISRNQVARVLVDDGMSSGRARFATGDPAEPFLWSGGPGRRHLRPRDDFRPNVALVLATPIRVRPRGDAGHLVVTEPALPLLRSDARRVFLAFEDPDAAAGALATWPLERPGPVPVLPAPLRPPQGQVPQGFMGLALGSGVVVLLLFLAGLGWLIPAWFVLLIPVVAGILRRHREGAAAALAAAGNDPAAVEAVRANWGHAFTDQAAGTSFGPPGR